MAGTLNASAIVTGVPRGPGIYDYSVALSDTGTTPIGTFWFAWIPGQDFMSRQPTAIGMPAGWTATVTTSSYPGGTGYAIEWVAETSASYLQPGGSSSAFTFTSAETPAQLAAASPFVPASPSTSSFVYQAAPFSGPGLNFTAAVACFPRGDPHPDASG